MSSYIQTYSGIMFDPLNPDVEKVNLEDIAHALSNTCRFTGHCRRFYSVAEHCVNVARLVHHKIAMKALLHDASEAYLCDIARPVKHAPEFAGYRALETRLEGVIYDYFGLTVTPAEHAEIKRADWLMVHVEGLQLLNGGPSVLRAWCPDTLDDARLFMAHTSFEVRCYRPEDAKSAFLSQFGRSFSGATSLQ